MDINGLKASARSIRALSMDGVQKANSGHPGMPMGNADVASLLYGELMKYNPADPKWIDRDRFVLSAGHGSMLIYSVLHLAGFNLSIEDLKNFRQLGSKTAGIRIRNDRRCRYNNGSSRRRNKQRGRNGGR